MGAGWVVVVSGEVMEATEGMVAMVVGMAVVAVKVVG